MIKGFLLSLGNFVAAEDGGTDNNLWVLLVLVGVFIVVMFVAGPMMRRKKQTQYVDTLHKSIQVGATVKTLGGLIGKIVSISDSDSNAKEVVLETGVEPTKSTMTFDIMYIYTVITNPDGSKYIPPNARPMPNKTTSSTVSVKVDDGNSESNSDNKLVDTTGQQPDMSMVDTTSQDGLTDTMTDKQ
jgi:preprotein translocase YajC subunit